MQALGEVGAECCSVVVKQLFVPWQEFRNLAEDLPSAKKKLKVFSLFTVEQIYF